MSKQYTKLLLSVCLFLALSMWGCSAEDDNLATVNVDISISERTMTPKEISVAKHDTVVFTITCDESGLIHIHGYDIEQEFEKSMGTQMQFAADITGQFNIAFHPNKAGHSGKHDHGHEHESHTNNTEETILGTLKVYPR